VANKDAEVGQGLIEAGEGGGQLGGGEQALGGATLGEDEAELGKPADPVAGDRLGEEASAGGGLGGERFERPRQRRTGLGVPAGRPGVDASGANTALARDGAQGGAGVRAERTGLSEVSREAVRRGAGDEVAVAPAASVLLHPPPLPRPLAATALGLAALPQRPQLVLAGGGALGLRRGEVCGRAQGHAGVRARARVFAPLRGFSPPYMERCEVIASGTPPLDGRLLGLNPSKARPRSRPRPKLL
jgi:hypothetical protein